MDRSGRAILVLVFISAILALLVHYGGTNSVHEQYPQPSEIEGDYDAHVGDRALLWGEVKSISLEDQRANISVLTANGTMRMTVDGFDTSVQSGGNIQVYGTLRSGQTIDADAVVVVNSSGASRLYKYATSAIGALLVVSYFFRHWWFDPDSLAFEVRGDG